MLLVVWDTRSFIPKGLLEKKPCFNFHFCCFAGYLLAYEDFQNYEVKERSRRWPILSLSYIMNHAMVNGKTLWSLNTGKKLKSNHDANSGAGDWFNFDSSGGDEGFEFESDDNEEQGGRRRRQEPDFFSSLINQLCLPHIRRLSLDSLDAQQRQRIVSILKRNPECECCGEYFVDDEVENEEDYADDPSSDNCRRG